MQGKPDDDTRLIVKKNLTNWLLGSISFSQRPSFRPLRIRGGGGHMADFTNVAHLTSVFVCPSYSRPLTGLTGLVAYDDDVASSASSDHENPPPPKGAVVSSIPPLVKSANPTKNVTALTGQPSTNLSEERRAQLREIELKVLKYQDELESSRKGDSSVTEEAINKVSLKKNRRQFFSLSNLLIITSFRIELIC